MFEAVAQIGLAVAMILPGFLVVQLSERRRPATPAGGDLELVLRGLVYALIIQGLAALTGWLPDLVHDLERGDWKDHLSALAVYGLVVCVILPTALGLGLGSVLQDAESKGALSWWHYALGGRDARRAWDYTFSRHNGAWMRVYLHEPPVGQPPVLVGKYGRESWAAQAPAEPDLYLQEVWPADQDGQIPTDVFEGGSIGGAWIDAERIGRVEVLAPDDDHGG